MEHDDEPGRASVPAGVRVTPVTADVGVEEARARFGGVDIPATLAGALAALGTAVLLAGILAGVGTYGYQLGMLGAGYLGGRLGERYHREADSLVARTRPGAVGSPRRIVRAS